MTPQEAIDLLSLAARSATWSGASPELAHELLFIVRTFAWRYELLAEALGEPGNPDSVDLVELARYFRNDRGRLMTSADKAKQDATEAGVRQAIAERERDEARAAHTVMAESMHKMEAQRNEARAEVERLTRNCAEARQALEDLMARDNAVIRALTVERNEARAEKAFERHLAECVNADPRPTPPVDVPSLGPASPADLVDRPIPPDRPSAHVEQPMPTGDGVEVFPAALEACGSQSLREMLAARDLIGRRRYGPSLRTNNGRDVVRDLREELADAYVYCSQAILEHREKGKRAWPLENVRGTIERAWTQLDYSERDE